MGDEKLDEFCREQLPTETNNKYIAFGLAYSAAKWNNNIDNIKKYLKTAITHHSDDEAFEEDEFFKPYMKTIKAYANKHW
jgi:hypothetical protein